jgi:heme-degrading monooxygenase HmoA
MPRLSASFASIVVAVGVSAGCEILSPNGDVAQPFQGPGFTDEGLTATVPENGVFVVGATRLVVADGDEPIELFNERMDAISAALEAGPPGLVGYSIRQNLFSRGGYRTVSVWESQDALWAFVLGDAHFAAIEVADRIGAEGTKVVQFTLPPEELPPRWDMVIEKTDTDGRPAY